MLSSTLRSVLSAREMAGFLTALLQAALLLKDSMTTANAITCHLGEPTKTFSFAHFGLAMLNLTFRIYYIFVDQISLSSIGKTKYGPECQ